MMKRLRFIIILLAIGSCKKQELPLYQGEHALYLMKNWQGKSAYSFVQNGTMAVKDTILEIPIVMVGGSQTMDAPLSYRIELETTNPDLISEADGSKIGLQQGYFDGKKNGDTLRLRVIRIPALTDSNLLVRVKLMVPAPYNVDIKGAEGSGLFRELEIVIDDTYPTPRSWEAFEDYLGSFSSKKMRIICQELMDSNSIWNDIESEFDYMAMTGMQWDAGDVLYDYLKEQRRLGRPVLERNGKEMKAGLLMYQ